MGNDESIQDPKVDRQDGGHGSHTEDDTGGTPNDVASGGQSQFANEDDSDGGAARDEETDHIRGHKEDDES